MNALMSIIVLGSGLQQHPDGGMAIWFSDMRACEAAKPLVQKSLPQDYRGAKENEVKATEPAIGEARSVEPSRQAIVRFSAQGGRGNLTNHEPGGFAMPIDTLDDIAEELADRLGIYGACKAPNDDECPAECNCRPNFVGGLLDRIRRAVEIEQRLIAANTSDGTRGERLVTHPGVFDELKRRGDAMAEALIKLTNAANERRLIAISTDAIPSVIAKWEALTETGGEALKQWRGE